VGTAVHHLLETLDLARELAGQVSSRKPAVIEEAVAAVDPAATADAASRTGELLDRLAGSACLTRLSSVASGVAARELSLFARPDGDDGTSVVSGAVDLVYRDPDDGRLVVADYKTDLVASEAETAERIERYRPQLAIYARALEQALDLGYRPHTELWFIHPDRVVRLS
jgi:ATP-dependent exoDNAse (exonuclease V) beta subunit